jgi:hypothetical protein
LDEARPRAIELMTIGKPPPEGTERHRLKTGVFKRHASYVL